MSMLRNALASTTPAVRAGTRAFRVSPAASKSATEKVKEVASDVNIKVGRTLASAIEKGEEATEATKETLAPAAQKAKEVTGQASQKASQATGQASQKASQATGQASQKANQTSAGVKEGARDFKEDVKKEARK
ncbi:uncharacterized protein C8Q71DRAFT_758592 [Rhodofomes roseus]|uniref:Phasin domain-containing protein n=1 Tax=Rhodofomes roseus TaxID=34475 RepID=A0ABQ8KFL6_9APHY|nr:uncharacterized protein C8Q71DRAFT_758592 [Rhodofomes roseus]KAH9836574.1 hypothetical protein C8Q71DRAFT_758592 [Rhodofomes roseus]